MAQEKTVSTVADIGTVRIADDVVAMIAAFAGAPMSCVQVALSSILYIVLGLALDKIGFKKKMEI